MAENMGALFWNVEKLVKKGEYLYAVVREHPRASRHGYVLHHRVVMENLLGRLLHADEIVHHLDGNKKNNSPDNLEVMPAREHSSLHARSHGKSLVELRCPQCSVVFLRRRGVTPKVASLSGKRAVFCSRRCSGIFNRRAVLHGLTKQMKSAISANIRKDLVVFEGNAEET